MLKELVGHKVMVWSSMGQAEARDIGVLERLEDGWIRLRKSDDEVLYLNLSRVRLVKSTEERG